jgi:hypothetical protein
MHAAAPLAYGRSGKEAAEEIARSTPNQMPLSTTCCLRGTRACVESKRDPPGTPEEVHGVHPAIIVKLQPWLCLCVFVHECGGSVLDLHTWNGSDDPDSACLCSTQAHRSCRPM